MAKQLLMTPKAINDRKRLEAKKNGTYQPRQLSQSKDNVRKREKYHRERHHWLAELTEIMKPESAAAVDFNAVVNTEPQKETALPSVPLVKITLSSPAKVEPYLDNLTRSELRQKVRELEKELERLNLSEEDTFVHPEPFEDKIYRIKWSSLIEMRKNLSIASYDLAEESRKLAEAEASIREKDSTAAHLKSEIQIARRQRDESNAHSKILSDNLEAANELIKKNNDSRVEIDRKISDFNINMGELNRIAIRWKFAFLTVLFAVAVPAVITASAAVYFLTHR